MEATAPISDSEAASKRDDQLVSEHLERWLAHMKGRVRVVTFEGYAELLRRHALPRLGSIALGVLMPLDVREFYDSLLVVRAEGRALAAGTVLRVTAAAGH